MRWHRRLRATPDLASSTATTLTICAPPPSWRGSRDLRSGHASPSLGHLHRTGRRDIAKARGALRIALLIDHPAQQFARALPLLAGEPGLRMQVYYWSTAERCYDEGFDRPVSWDIDLLGHGAQINVQPRRNSSIAMAFRTGQHDPCLQRQQRRTTRLGGHTRRGSRDATGLALATYLTFRKRERILRRT